MIGKPWPYINVNLWPVKSVDVTGGRKHEEMTRTPALPVGPVKATANTDDHAPTRLYSPSVSDPRRQLLSLALWAHFFPSFYSLAYQLSRALSLIFYPHFSLCFLLIALSSTLLFIFCNFNLVFRLWSFLRVPKLIGSSAWNYRRWVRNDCVLVFHCKLFVMAFVMLGYFVWFCLIFLHTSTLINWCRNFDRECMI